MLFFFVWLVGFFYIVLNDEYDTKGIKAQKQNRQARFHQTKSLWAAKEATEWKENLQNEKTLQTVHLVRG